MRAAIASFFIPIVVSSLGCSDGTGGGASRYADESLWLCRPGIVRDQCALADLSTTEIRADGTVVVSDGPYRRSADSDARLNSGLRWRLVRPRR